MAHTSYRSTIAGALATATIALGAACATPHDEGESISEDAQNAAIFVETHTSSNSGSTAQIAELHLDSGHRIIFQRVVNDGLPGGWGIDAVEVGSHGDVSPLGAVLAEGGTMLEAFLALAPESTPPLAFFDDHDAQTEARGGEIADIRDFAHLADLDPLLRVNTCTSYTLFKSTVNDIGQLKKSKSGIGTFSISRSEGGNQLKFGLACNSTRQPGSSNDQITVEYCLNGSCDSPLTLYNNEYAFKWWALSTVGTHQAKAKSPYPDAFRAYLALAHHP